MTGRIGLFITPLLFTIATFEINRYVTIRLLEINPNQEINFISQAITIFLFLIFAAAGKIISHSKILSLIIEKLSDLTYSVYLLHMAIGVFLLSKFRHSSPNEYITILCVFVLVSIIAAITFTTIEKPGIMLFKRVICRR